MVATHREMMDTGLDTVLVARLKSGDRSAFNQLFHRHYERVLSRLVHNLRLPRTDAEEIANDVFVRVERGISKFRGDSSFATWLFRITVNLARNRYWYLQRRRTHLMDSFDTPRRDDSLTLAEIIPSETRGPGDDMDVEELSDAIASAMERIKPRQREILTLLIIKHATYKEIASILGIKVGTVKSRIARAREELRQMTHNKR